MKHCLYLYGLDNQISQLVLDGGKLDRYLFARHVPLEGAEIYSAKKQIEREILLKTSFGHDAAKSGKL